MTALPTPQRVYIQEVSPRDGLQIEPNFVSTADKIALIDRLSQAGFAKIEVTSFVSPKAVPNLRDAAEVMRQIEKVAGVCYVALVPNLRGAMTAADSRVDEINLVMSASETHNRANMRMTCEQSLSEFGKVAAALGGSSIAINGTVATAFGCPFEGVISRDRTLGLAEDYLALGIQTITLADTTGMANPRQVAETVAAFRRRFAGVPLTLHFHDTRGMGLANVVAALGAGADRFDASLGGLGGCPFAPGASGNISTEDVVHMLDAMQVRTGVNLPLLIELSRGLPALLGHSVPGQVAKAGRSIDLHPVPAGIGRKEDEQMRFGSHA